MDHISDSLNHRLNQRSLSITAQAAYVCHVANSLAKGRYLAQSFRSGTLTLAVPSPAAAQDLKFQKANLLIEINASLSAPAVTSIRIVVDTNPDRES